ncbi:hypothetical protein VM98_34265, partial [Streptomyces rubellomurinus subsp. indigoferus]
MVARALDLVSARLVPHLAAPGRPALHTVVVPDEGTPAPAPPVEAAPARAALLPCAVGSPRLLASG